jgi:hypothetical protein
LNRNVSTKSEKGESHRSEEEIVKRLAIDKILGRGIIDKLSQGSGGQITSMGI